MKLVDRAHEFLADGVEGPAACYHVQVTVAERRIGDVRGDGGWNSCQISTSPRPVIRQSLALGQGRLEHRHDDLAGGRGWSWLLLIGSDDAPTGRWVGSGIGMPTTSSFLSAGVLEVPQPSEPATPAVPEAPVSPAVPDPDTPADPEEPADVPAPEEPATPIGAEEPATPSPETDPSEGR